MSDALVTVVASNIPKHAAGCSYWQGLGSSRKTDVLNPAGVLDLQLKCGLHYELWKYRQITSRVQA